MILAIVVTNLCTLVALISVVLYNSYIGWRRHYALANRHDNLETLFRRHMGKHHDDPMLLTLEKRTRPTERASDGG